MLLLVDNFHHLSRMAKGAHIHSVMLQMSPFITLHLCRPSREDGSRVLVADCRQVSDSALRAGSLADAGS